ncbi:MAG TPA: hypothetical protein VF778_04360, partial [Xanthobacteraceae bacterium]
MLCPVSYGGPQPPLVLVLVFIEQPDHRIRHDAHGIEPVTGMEQRRRRQTDHRLAVTLEPFYFVWEPAVAVWPGDDDADHWFTHQRFP